jgi:hypothetical protein
MIEARLVARKKLNLHGISLQQLNKQLLRPRLQLLQ